MYSRGAHLQVDRLATLKTLAVESHLHQGRLAGNDKRFGLAISMSNPVAQDETNRVGSVLDVGRSEESSLPDVLYDR